MHDSDDIRKQYYSIGEVEEIIGVPQSTLRFWEEKFEELEPRKNRRGNRAYTAKDLDLLKRIAHLLNEEEYTISGAIKVLRKKTKANPSDKQVRETLTNLRSFLVGLKESL
ncbi:MAG: MerR family transcriptional regulator [Bacteroidia bacterium]